jgi:hypothetical protein
MNPPPRLRLEPRPSRIGCAAIAVSCTAMASLALLLPVDPWSKAAALLAIAAIAGRGFWRCTGRGVPAIVHVGCDRRMTATTRDGRTRDGSILEASYVGAYLTTIVWRPDCAPRFSPSRAILILPDVLPADDFRRLRVLLRYGRPTIERDTRGLDAG